MSRSLIREQNNMADNESGELEEDEDVHELMIELRRSEPGNELSLKHAGLANPGVAFT